MDSSAGNRYELLCNDDDASDPLETLVRKKAKQQKQKNPQGGTAGGGNNAAQTLSGGGGGGNLGGAPVSSNTAINQQNRKIGGGNQIAEKENKSSAMNKNFDKKYGSGGGGHLPAGSIGSGGSQKQKGNNNITANNSTGGPIKESNYRNSQDQQRQPREGKNFERNVNFKANQETREQRNNRRNRDDRPINQQMQQNGNIVPGEYTPNSERPQRQRGPPRRNFDSNPNRGGKREFDRQSGSDKTGVKAIDKRDGGGAHNWGSHKQDIEDINKANDESAIDKDDSAGEQQTETQPTFEEETKELTLDEWKAQRAVRAKPQFNIRKAGEGEDLSQWKKMIALNNKKRDEESEEELEYDPSMYPQRVGRLQRVVDIEFHFNDGRRSGGIGRGRGRARGPGGGAGAGAGGAAGGRQGGRVSRNVDHVKTVRIEGGGERQRSGQHAPKVDDEHDFPSLG